MTRVSPERKAKILVAVHGPGMAMNVACRWVMAHEPTRTETDWYWYWSSVVMHLRVLEKHRRRPHAKSEKRKLREEMQAARRCVEARA